MLLILSIIVLFGLVPDENNNSNLHPSPCGGTSQVLRTSMRRGDALEVNMKQVALRHSSVFAIVDDEDYERVSKKKWYLSRRAATAWHEGKMVKMHRFIMSPQPSVLIDHIDHDILNNQKSNLRFATDSQNVRNRSKGKKKTSSIFKGVYLSKRGVKRWCAAIRGGSSTIYIGSYMTEKEAGMTYDEAAIRLHGEFACTNKMMGLL